MLTKIVEEQSLLAEPNDVDPSFAPRCHMFIIRLIRPVTALADRWVFMLHVVAMFATPGFGAVAGAAQNLIGLDLLLI